MPKYVLSVSNGLPNQKVPLMFLVEAKSKKEANHKMLEEIQRRYKNHFGQKYEIINCYAIPKGEVQLICTGYED